MLPPSKKIESRPRAAESFYIHRKGYSIYLVSCVYSCSCFAMSQEKTLPRNLPGL